MTEKKRGRRQRGDKKGREEGRERDGWKEGDFSDCGGGEATEEGEKEAAAESSRTATRWERASNSVVETSADL